MMDTITDHSDFQTMSKDRTTLSNALEDANTALHMFLDNEFEASKNILTPYSHSSMYHSMALAYRSMNYAFFTMERVSIEIEC